MLFKKEHSLINDKPINIIKNQLKSSNDDIRVSEISEEKLHGLMKNKYGTGFSIVSEIDLESISSEKTSIRIKNQFDLITNLLLIGMFIVLWGISIYKLTIGDKTLSYELILMLTFPIIGTLITKLSFIIYDKRIMKIYYSLLNSKEPN